MKKLFVVSLVLLAFSLSASAQDFKPFRVDGGIGYGIPFNEGLDGGILFYLEPKYEVIPQLSVGIRWEGAFFGGGSDEGVSIKMSSGYLATGDYYFNNNSFRPFVGAGLGVFASGGASVNVGTETIKVDGSTNFATMVRAGFDISHFRLTASYNLAFDEDTLNFLAITVGFYIGGGKKR